MLEKYLPIGSIVLLSGGQKRLMIYGRKQRQLETGTIWDYVGCLYPEGNLDEEHMYLFNHDQVEQVFFLGFQDEEEIRYAEQVLGRDEAAADSGGESEKAS